MKGAAEGRVVLFSLATCAEEWLFCIRIYASRMNPQSRFRRQELKYQVHIVVVAP